MTITWQEMQREYLLRLIVDLHGNIHRIARASGLAKATVYRMIRNHGLENDVVLARLSRRHHDEEQELQ